MAESDFGLPGSTGLNNSSFFRERQIQLAVSISEESKGNVIMIR
jgi:hypothetical protein